jgi:hypothetical protein
VKPVRANCLDNLSRLAIISQVIPAFVNRIGRL